ncbi:Protein of unknown function (DUF1262) [Melia azedarach]|uniref:Uncharacterized protein n=1 Tax=Melia azedarach TaxID=155640 RepID=A0ACC1X5P7_MELAZ|nr:Protein of unknown function (DUF1262) [Melia azedarach]
MYVTRPLSMYRRDPSALSLPPPEGPNSGILVILDEEAQPTCCFGSCKSNELRELPFPQNKNLRTYFTTTSNNGNHSSTDYHYSKVVFVPVLNQPLSSNQYYAIQPRGRHQGEAFTNSKEEDMSTCCFCQVIKDRKPEPFDPNNIYQQIEIYCGRWGSFSAKSVEPDGFPPKFLREGWSLEIQTPRNFDLGEAPGLDNTLRARLPDFSNLSLSSKSSKPVVVGKWYSPFIFIKESSLTLKQQMSRSMYYEMTLEQRWEQIFSCENGYNEDNAVVVDVAVEREVVSLAGTKKGVANENINVADGVMWFRSVNAVGGEVGVGLNTAITERMQWEQERFGWNVRGNDRQVRVKRVEEFGGVNEWRKFGCYMLVERFVLKRMDGSLVLTYDFNHTHQIRTKWE